MSDLDDKLEQLRAAIEDEGPQPRHHRKVMKRHRREWPTLWAAIDDLLTPPSRTPIVLDYKAAKRAYDDAPVPIRAEDLVRRIVDAALSSREDGET